MLQAAVLATGVLSSALIGWFVLTRDPKKQVNQLYGFLTLTFISLTVFNHLTLSPTVYLLEYMRLVIVSTTLACATLLLLLLEIRRSQGKVLPSGMKWLVGGITAAVAVLELTPSVFVRLTDGVSPTPVPGWGIGVFILHFILVIGICIAVLLAGTRNAHDKERKQYRTMLIGIMPILFLAPLTSVVLPVFFHVTAFVVISPLYLVFFLAMIGYAIIRHGLFDVRMAAVRTLAYALSLLTLACIYGVLAFGVSQMVFGYNSSVEQSAVNIVLALLLAFIFQPVKRFFDVLTDQIFYRNNYNSQNVLDQLGDIVVRNVLLKPMLTRTLDLISGSIRPVSAHFYLTKEGEKIAYIANTHENESLSEKAKKLLDNFSVPVTVLDSLSVEENEKYEVLQKEHVKVVVNLHAKQGYKAHLVLGEKASGSKYTQRDVDLLAVMADELAVAVENSMRYEEIKAFNKTLQEKVEEATAELKVSNKKLQELDKSKDEFISMASHQLRTPLTAVKGYVSMMLDGDVGKITKEQRQVLEQAYDSSQRMVFLIGDFLNVSRLQTGKFVLEPSQIDFSKLVEEEVDQLRDTARMRNITISYSKPSGSHVSFGDENKLRQVMMNFMDNAIFYSPANSKVTVQLYKEPGQIVFKVNDQGIGVPKEAQAKLFTKFYRASNARQMRPDGTGIGIYMAKKVVLAHGGNVVFESREGVGSTFGFKLPLRDDPKQFDKQPGDTA